MSKTKREKIAAIVVTYNRKNLLIECLDTLLEQTYSLDAIYIIDNASTDGSSELLMEKGLVDSPLYPDMEPMESTKVVLLPAYQAKSIEIHYVRMNENTGGAGGFHEGIKRGYEAGYDWIWIMDDDGKPDSSCLEILINVSKKHKLLVSCPLLIDREDHDKMAGSLYDPISKRNLLTVMEIKKYGEIFKYHPIFFNGVLINREVLSKIGFPKKEFFCWGDEVEFILRIRRNRFNIATLINAKFYHPSYYLNTAKLFGIKVNLAPTKGLRLYCPIRNYVIIFKDYKGVVYSLVFSSKQLVKYFLFSIQKWDIEYFKTSILAIYHGLTNKFGHERKYLG